MVTWLGAATVFWSTPLLVLVALLLMFDPKGALEILGLNRERRAGRPLAPSTRRWIRAGACVGGFLLLWWTGLLLEIIRGDLAQGSHSLLHYAWRGRGGLTHALLFLVGVPVLLAGSVVIPVRVWRVTRAPMARPPS
jgi:hypothetical protein